MLGIAATIANIFFYLKLRRIIRQVKPDIIRYHSTARRMGWM